MKNETEKTTESTDESRRVQQTVIPAIYAIITIITLIILLQSNIQRIDHAKDMKELYIQASEVFYQSGYLQAIEDVKMSSNFDSLRHNLNLDFKTKQFSSNFWKN